MIGQGEELVTNIDVISEKVFSNQRLNIEDLRGLLKSQNIIGLALLADQVTRKLHSNKVSYHEHQYIRCLPMHKQGEIDLIDRVLEQGRHLVTPSTSELRLVAIRPAQLPSKTLARMIQSLKAQFPGRVLRGLSAHQVLSYCKQEKTQPAELLGYLKDCGLDALEGRGLKHASLLALERGQWTAQDLWLEVQRLAHQVGLSSDATFSYETTIAEDQEVLQLSAIRDLQDQTGGFQSLIPLNPRLGLEDRKWQPRTALRDLKVVAICRLFLDNISIIKAPWGRMGINLAQLALSFGANHLEGSLSNDKNSFIAGAKPFRSMNRQELASLVRKAGRLPDDQSSQNGPSFDAKPLLYKLSRGASLPQNERLDICNQPHLMELASCGSDIKSGLMPKQGISFHCPHIFAHQLAADPSGQCFDTIQNLQGPKSLIFDLGNHWEPALSLTTIESTVERVKKVIPKIELAVHGLKGLWQLAKLEDLSLLKLAVHLKELGFNVAESSTFEAEDDLTHGEIKSTHSTLHEANISTVGKAELASTYHGGGRPFWDFFLERLEVFSHLQVTTHGMLGVKVESARGSNISPTEYLRAVAISRIFLKEIPNIIWVACVLG